MSAMTDEERKQKVKKLRERVGGRGGSTQIFPTLRLISSG
jgi:hypothetical protein